MMVAGTTRPGLEQHSKGGGVKKTKTLTKKLMRWRDENNKFTLHNGIVGAGFIRFKIRRTRKSPALRFRMGEDIMLCYGRETYHARVYSFKPRSSTGSDIAASGTLTLFPHNDIADVLHG
jgi:hypothetical protein